MNSVLHTDNPLKTISHCDLCLFLHLTFILATEFASRLTRFLSTEEASFLKPLRVLSATRGLPNARFYFRSFNLRKFWRRREISREKEISFLRKNEKLKSKMDQVSFCASQFSGITTPKLGMVAPGEGINIWSLGLLITIKALANDTGGSYSLVETLVHPGQGVPRHVHALEDEMWYMLEGELIWNLGGRESLGRQGSFIHLPRFVPHFFMNRSEKPARMLLMFTPGGFERWFLDVGRVSVPEVGRAPKVGEEELRAALERWQEYGVVSVDVEENGGFSHREFLQPN